MKKSIATKTAERLELTQEGKALLALVEAHGTPANLAAKIGVDPQLMRCWLHIGRLPEARTIEIAKTLRMKPQQLRPDLPLEKWKPKRHVEKEIREPVARTADARMLVSLAEQYGGVKELCDVANCTAAEYHTWKYRGRIPAIRLPTFLEMAGVSHAPQWHKAPEGAEYFHPGNSKLVAGWYLKTKAGNWYFCENGEEWNQVSTMDQQLQSELVKRT